MTSQDHKKIAQAIKNFNKKVEEQEDTGNDFDQSQFLVDEFAYMLEKDKNFNEKEFKQFIYNL